MTDAGDLYLEIDYPNEDAGWIDCYLTFDGLTHKLNATATFPPFQDMLHFLRALHTQRLPANYYWEEEGYGANFDAWPLAPDSPDFHLRVVHDVFNVIWVDADLNRESVIDVFLTAMRDFALFASMTIRDDWDVSLQDVIDFEDFRRQEVVLRSEINSAGEIRFDLQRQQLKDMAHQYLEVWMWGRRFEIWFVYDTDPFWPAWFAFLERVLRGEPAEMTFIDMGPVRIAQKLIADGTITPDERGKDYFYTLRGIPLDHPRHFRFQLFTSKSRHVDYLLLDEVLDRAQFARAFLVEFEDVLANDYRLYPDEDGAVFDLRSLPLDRIQEALSRLERPDTTP